jgi:hypothetical protein
MIGPDLDPDIVLAVQTLDFRSDWKELYENAVLAEPEVFVEVLGRYRSGDAHAFEDLWPDVGVLPLDLSDFLRSGEGEALTRAADLERYVSLVETTSSSQSWVQDAMRECGMLRRHTRAVRPPLTRGSPQAREIAERLKEALGRLDRYTSPARSRLVGVLEELSRLVNELVVAGPDDDPSAHDAAAWQQRTTVQIDRLQQELRLIRRSSAFAA